MCLSASINPQLGLFDLSGLYLELRKFFCALIQQLEPGVQRKCAEERLSKANKGIVINLSIALNQICLSLAPLTRLLIKGGYAGAKPCDYLEQIIKVLLKLVTSCLEMSYADGTVSDIPDPCFQ